MNAESRTILVLAVVAVGAAVVVSAAVKSAVAGEIKAARDHLFEIGPNCETITFKEGLGGDPDPERLKLAERMYFMPFVQHRMSSGAEDEAASLGITLVDLLTENVLADLFPECPGKWPPETLFSSFGMIWVAMKAYMADLVGRVQA